MRVQICIALLLVAQAMGFSVPKTVRDWDTIEERWASGSLGAHDPVLRNGQGAKGFSDVGKIVNGEEATPNEFPWVVGLFMAGGSFCTGSLISDEWVLTAAHCQDGALYTEVHLGAHRVREPEPNQIVLRATEKYIHPEWNSATLRGDIALIRLPSKVDITGDLIKPIRLATSETNNHIGETALIAGWGKTSDASAGISPTLQKGFVTVISNAQCQNTYGIIIQAWSICTSVEPTGTCNGDSGGAMSVQEADGLYTQIGVTSFVSSSGCQSGLPDGFARVSYFRDWITQISGV